MRCSLYHSRCRLGDKAGYGAGNWLQNWRQGDAEVKLHSRYPGKIKAALKAEGFQRLIPGSSLTALMHSLESGGEFQRDAFGMKLVEILGGHKNVMIKNIERSQKASWLAASFVIELDHEASGIVEKESLWFQLVNVPSWKATHTGDIFTSWDMEANIRLHQRAPL
jgi:hypothetical protein